MMDATFRKLEFPHCFVKAQAVTQLLSSSRQSLKEKKNASQDLDIIWKNCCEVTNAELGYMCADAIVTLTSEGFLNGNEVISKAVNYGSSCKDISCLLHIIVQLLQMHVSKHLAHSLQPYHCPYNLRGFPHPFISIISSRPNSWHCVLSQIQHTIDFDYWTLLSSSKVEMVKPVILYILFNPSSSDDAALCKFRLMSILLKIAAKPKRDVGQKTAQNPVLEILWPALMHSEPSIDTHKFFKKLIRIHSSSPRAAVVAIKLLKFCHEASSNCQRITIIKSLTTILQQSEANGACLKLIAVGIAYLLSRFPISVLADVLVLTEMLLMSDSAVLPSIVLHILHAALLQLQLMASTNMLNQRTSTISKLLLHLDKMIEKATAYEPMSRGSLEELLMLDIYVIEIFSTCELLLRISSSQTIAVTWLDSVESAIGFDNLVEADVHSTSLILNALFLHALHLCKTTASGHEVATKALHCIGRLAKLHPRLSYSILPTLIYSMKEATGILVHEICFVLPSLANHPYCVAPILNIIRSLSSDMSLKPMALRLMIDLWKIQDRCYSQLQNMLSSIEIGGVRKKGQTYDFNLMKAVAIYTICKERPHQYGSDMLKLMNPILLFSGSSKCDQAVVAFALDGLYHLCYNKVLNFMTMWEELGDTLQSKPDGLLLGKVLDIVSLLPTFKIDSPEYEMSCARILIWIWSKVESKDGVTVGSALRCLAQFDMQNFKVKHFPQSLRPEKLEDMSEEEYLDKRAPGSSFIKLLLCSGTENFKDFDVFMTSLLKQELQLLPRDIHHRAIKSQLQASQPKPLKAIPEFVITSYERNRQPAMKSCLASTLLLCYTTTPEVSAAGDPVRRSLVTQGRRSMDIFQALLKETTIDPNNWQSLLWCAHGWKNFMKKCLACMVLGRRAEVEMQKTRKLNSSEETEDDIQHKFNTALLWCRDKITNALKSASKGNPSMQGNAVFALVGLVTATNTSENIDEENTQESDTEYIKMPHWTTMALDTVMSIANSKHIPSGRIMSWCQYRAVSSSGKLSTTQLGKICAIHALSFATSVTMQNHISKIFEMLAFLKKGDPNSEENLEFHRYLSLGNVLSTLYRETKGDHFGTSGSLLIQECLATLYDNIQGCLSKSHEHPLQDNLGSLLGFGLALSSKFQSSDVAFHTMGKRMLTQILHFMENEELSPDCVQAVFTMLTWSYLSGFVNSIFSADDVKELIKVLQRFVDDDPSKSGYSESLGTLCNGLYLCGDSTVVEVMNKLFQQWHALLQKDHTPTREKLAALAGFCSLVGANTTLSPVAVDPAMLGSNHYLTKLSVAIKTLRQFSRSSHDPGIPSRSVILLGHLYMSLESSSSAIGSIVPASYDYLTGTSVLKFMFSVLSEVSKPDSQMRPEVIRTILSSISKNCEDFILPPVNWTLAISSILSGSHDAELKSFAISVLVSQCGQACSSLLASWASPKKVDTLPKHSIGLLYQNLDKVIKSQEDAKVAEILEFSVSHCITFVQENVNAEVCEALLDGMAKTLKISNTLTDSVKEMLCNTIERLFLHLPFSCCSNLQINLMRKVAFCAEYLPDANALVAKCERKDGSSSNYLRSLFLRCWCTINGTHTLSMCNNIVLHCGMDEKICEEALWIISVCLRGIVKKISVGKKIEWLQELMGEIKKLSDFPEGNVGLIEYLLNIFVMALALWSSAGAILPVKSGFAENGVNCLNSMPIVINDCLSLLPISTSRIFGSAKWEVVVQPMVDWLALMIGRLQNMEGGSKYVPQFINAISTAKNTKAYKLPSMWCKVVSSVCQME